MDLNDDGKSVLAAAAPSDAYQDSRDEHRDVLNAFDTVLDEMTAIVED